MRWSEHVCVLEGPDLVIAALEADAEFEALFVDTSAAGRADLVEIVARATARGVRAFGLDPAVLAKVADAQTPQPISATVRFATPALSAMATGALTLVLHDLRDPGNVGTIIRSADAAGVGAVILTGQSVDPYNPKTLRATAGSIFHVPVGVGDLDATLEHFERAGSHTWATVVRGGTELLDCDLSGPSVVVIGNEADGLDAATIDRCQSSLSIAMAGTNESLNAGVAASLVSFVAYWQRVGRVAPPIPRSLGES